MCNFGWPLTGGSENPPCANGPPWRLTVQERSTEPVQALDHAGVYREEPDGAPASSGDRTSSRCNSKVESQRQSAVRHPLELQKVAVAGWNAELVGAWVGCAWTHSRPVAWVGTRSTLVRDCDVAEWDIIEGTGR